MELTKHRNEEKGQSNMHKKCGLRDWELTIATFLPKKFFISLALTAFGH
jgi:hypothetical protein